MNEIEKQEFLDEINSFPCALNIKSLIFYAKYLKYRHIQFQAVYEARMKILKKMHPEIYEQIVEETINLFSSYEEAYEEACNNEEHDEF